MRFSSIFKSGIILMACSGLVFSQETVSDEPFKQAISNLKHKDPQVRRQSAESLGRMRNPAATDALLKLFSDPVPYVRSMAIESIGLMRVISASAAIAKLLETDKEAAVRQTCAIALGYIADRNSVPSLVKGIKDSHEGTRLACINSLGIIRDGSAVDALAKELKSSDARLRNSSAYALGNIGDKSAVPFLVEALKIARSTAPTPGNEGLVDPLFGATIVRSLGLINDPSAIPILKKLLEDKDKKVKLNVCSALLRLGDQAGLTVAREFVKDSDPSARRISIELLGELGDKSDLDMLKNLKPDPEVALQQTVKQSIERLSKKIQTPSRSSPPSKPSKKSKLPVTSAPRK